MCSICLIERSTPCSVALSPSSEDGFASNAGFIGLPKGLGVVVLCDDLSGLRMDLPAVAA